MVRIYAFLVYEYNVLRLRAYIGNIFLRCSRILRLREESKRSLTPPGTRDMTGIPTTGTFEIIKREPVS